MRSYGQFCGLAFGLDIIGDRWNMLIVRNLILGPQRWKEMRFNLPGIAKNLLSKRLKDLTDAGVIVSDKETYALTEKGRELEPIIFGIARWGETHFIPPKGVGHEKRKRFFYTSLRRKMLTSKNEATVLLRVDQDILVASLGPTPTLVQVNEGVLCDSELATDFSTFSTLIFSDKNWKEFELSGKVKVKGSRRAANELMRVLYF